MLEPDERAAAGRLPRLPVPGRDSRRRRHDLPQDRAQRAAAGEAGEPELSTPDFIRRVKEASETLLHMTQEMLRRPINIGFSGGEKKRNEILQMALLEPSLAVLDETDSGLDIDALRVVADGVNALRSPERSMLVITHYQRLLDYIVPDFVHVMSAGRIVRSGGKELALELEEKRLRRLWRRRRRGRDERRAAHR